MKSMKFPDRRGSRTALHSATSDIECCAETYRCDRWDRRTGGTSNHFFGKRIEMESYGISLLVGRDYLYFWDSMDISIVNLWDFQQPNDGGKLACWIVQSIHGPFSISEITRENGHLSERHFANRNPNAFGYPRTYHCPNTFPPFLLVISCSIPDKQEITR